MRLPSSTPAQLSSLGVLGSRRPTPAAPKGGLVRFLASNPFALIPVMAIALIAAYWSKESWTSHYERWTHRQPSIERMARIDAIAHQDHNIRTSSAQRLVLNDTFQAAGTVAWDLDRSVKVVSPQNAVIEHINVLAKDTPLESHDALAEILVDQHAISGSEETMQPQMDNTKMLNDSIHFRADRLAPMNIRSTYFPNQTIILRAPKPSVVRSLDVQEGQHVTEGQTLFTLNDLDVVWVEATVPQALVGQIRPGINLTVYGSAWPGKRWTGTVDALLPDIDPSSHRQRVRIVLPNREGILRPGQFVQVAFAPMQPRPMLVVPDDALIATDETSMRVVVSLGGGHFRSAPVKTGYTAGGYTEITEGLQDGDQVVVSGQFMIHS